MAIIEFGTMVIGARGTIGGATFSANKAGPFVRAWSKGGNPRSPLQTDNRNVFTRNSTGWGLLTQADRDGWDDYADDPAQELTNSLGIDYFISGFNWYVKINSALLQAGASVRDEAPTLTRLVAPSSITLTVHETGGASSQVAFDGGDPTINDRKAIFSRAFNSVGREFVSSGFAFTKSGDIVATNRITISGNLRAIFGNQIIGQKYFCEVVNQDAQGQRSPIITDNTICIA